MKVLYLHGWNSVVGGVKPTYLKSHGHDVHEPSLDHGDFQRALETAQRAFDQHQPEVVVGSSRGGAVAVNLDSAKARLVLICPAWKKWGSVKITKPGTLILHSRADDVVPFQDSLELISKSGLPETALIDVGQDHRLADPEPLEALLRAVERR
jgi:alpha-beta hydrolase superfamily lysophospholipase